MLSCYFCLLVLVSYTIHLIYRKYIEKDWKICLYEIYYSVYLLIVLKVSNDKHYLNISVRRIVIFAIQFKKKNWLTKSITVWVDYTKFNLTPNECMYDDFVFTSIEMGYSALNNKVKKYMQKLIQY